MSAVPFDTLKLADRLEAGGFTSQQSRSAASAFAEAMSGAELTTKGDLRELEARLEGTIKATVAEAKADTLRWVFGAMAAQTALIVGLVKLLGH